MMKKSEMKKASLKKPSKLDSKIKEINSFNLGKSKLVLYKHPSLHELKEFKMHHQVTMVISLLNPLKDKVRVNQISKDCQSLEIKNINIPLVNSDIEYLEQENVITLIKNHLIEIVKTFKETNNVILLHCQLGVHRTGLMAYTILRIFGDNKNKALEHLKFLREKAYDKVGDARLKYA